MSSIQCALGEGHMTRHEDLLRMDYGNATCLMDCVKPNLFKVHIQWLPYNVYCIEWVAINGATIFRRYVKDVYLLT